MMSHTIRRYVAALVAVVALAVAGCGGTTIKDYNEGVAIPKIPVAGGAPGESSDNYAADENSADEPAPAAAPASKQASPNDPVDMTRSADFQ